MAIQGKITSLYSDRENTEALFPRTKVNAISDDNNIGLDAILRSAAYSDPLDNGEAATTPLDADSLAGIPAKDYATQIYVKNEIANAQLNGSGGSGNVDLSGFATKDDITNLNNTISNIDFPVDSVNGKTGAVNFTATDIGAAKALMEKMVMSYADYHAAPNDLLNVQLDGNREVDNMQPSYIATENASTLYQSPVSSGAFYAVRTVEYFPNPGHVIVRLHESYPNNGRIWSNMYDNNIKDWYGWKENYSMDKATTSYVDNLIINNNSKIAETYITDVLHVALNNPSDYANRSGYFDSSAQSCPPNTAFGIRKVIWVNDDGGFVIVEANCFLWDSSSVIYRNTYNVNAGGWLGWDLVYDSRHKPSAADVGAAPSSHNHDGRYIQCYSLNEINIDNTNGNWTVDIVRGQTGGNVPADWVNVTQTTSGHFFTQIARQVVDSYDGNRASGRIWYREKYANGRVWSAWTPLVSTANLSYSNGTLYISV